MTARYAQPNPKRLTAATGAIVAILLAAVVGVTLAISPASAVDDPTNPELVRAQTQLADCQAMRAGATNSSQRAWGDNCILLAQRWITRLTASPSPSPSSTPTASPSTPPSPSPTLSTSPPTPSPSPTTLPSPSPTPTPGPTVPSGCALPLYPTPDCTGTPAGWTPTRTINGDYTASLNGELIDGWRITGSLLIRAQNVVVRNSEVYTRIYNQASGVAYNGLVIVDTTVGPPSGVSNATTGAIGVCGYVARRVEIRNAPEGWRVGGDGYSGGRCGPVEISDSYARLRSTGNCDHNDGVQGYDEPPGTVIAHNTIDMSNVGCSTGAIYVGDPFGATVLDNLLLGGSYVMRLHSSGSETSYPAVTGNRIVNGAWDYGPVLVDACSTIAVWRDNTVVEIDADYRVTSTVRRLTTCVETP